MEITLIQKLLLVHHGPCCLHQANKFAGLRFYPPIQDSGPSSNICNVLQHPVENRQRILGTTTGYRKNCNSLWWIQFSQTQCYNLVTLFKNCPAMRLNPASYHLSVKARIMSQARSSSRSSPSVLASMKSVGTISSVYSSALTRDTSSAVASWGKRHRVGIFKTKLRN